MGDLGDSSPASLDLSNIQGDILLDGLPKLYESFFFFKIVDGRAKSFCQSLAQAANEIASVQTVTTVRNDINNHKDANPSSSVMPIAAANIAFSMKGLQKMSEVLKNLDLNTGDNAFQQGMKNGAASLQDPLQNGSGMPAWESPFLQDIDGIVLVAGSDPGTVAVKLSRVQRLFNFQPSQANQQASISEVDTVLGKVRPGEFKGHEHFGYADGISQPAVAGVDKTVPNGQDTVDQGIILCGRGGQPRPQWMQDGSFLTFRKLAQDVSAWNKFLVDTSNQIGTWSDQLGSRLIGRWKSGCPVTLSPDFDNKTIGADPNQNNSITFDRNSDFRCPIAAHIRKTNPRDDLGRSTVNNFRILRRGIPYGDELDANPSGERGLLFVCYQSSIENGFKFIQETWANNEGFFAPGTGLDAVLGQSNNPNQATFSSRGLFPQDPNRLIQLKGVNQFVKPKGGEYFFSPSMTALRTTLSAVK